MEKVNIGIIGLGPRAETLLASMDTTPTQVVVSPLASLGIEKEPQKVLFLLGQFRHQTHLLPLCDILPAGAI